MQPAMTGGTQRYRTSWDHALLPLRLKVNWNHFVHLYHFGIFVHRTQSASPTDSLCVIVACGEPTRRLGNLQAHYLIILTAGGVGSGGDAGLEEEVDVGAELAEVAGVGMRLRNLFT